ncbi:uncharacterized protein LOC119401432 isoform X8 [Rhipicephalus sanguineus]|uniref:uncharacterized protein LOC119401432 isoform X8 n=1 Tax=Rhipicephalus sanguineus TaxID=34632 RepID=UPI001894EE17|nr:uncharacterized protein LOC119401432 isoform X8 [Rhipicephalus sanguineus]
MRSVETLGILMPPSVTSGSGISCGGQRTRDRMLQEGQQTQSMVPAFSWAAFFLNIACSLGHGRVQSETTTCQPFSMQTPAGLVSAVVSVCISKTKANTDTSRAGEQKWSAARLSAKNQQTE